MADPDDLLDDVSAAENRRDFRLAAIIAIITIATALLASLFVVIAGIST